MIENKSISSRIRNVVIYVIYILLTLVALLPLWNVVCISFSSGAAVEAGKVKFSIVNFSAEAYRQILKDAQYWRSFGISVLRVVLGVSISLYMTIVAAFPLSKNKSEFWGRNIIMGILVFSMLFSGGMIPQYLLIKKLGLINTLWVLVLPGISVGNIIMTMNFFAGISKALEEAAIIDGANPIQVLVKIYIPCSKPVIATMALFSMVSHWNDYFSGLIYITKKDNWPLMSYVQSLQMDMAEIMQMKNVTAEEYERAMALSGPNFNAAKVFVTLIPLMLVYPFVQKYLIHGITLGAVKE